MAPPLVSDRLSRLARHRMAVARSPLQWCELCSEPLPDEHRHLLETRQQEIRCACRACSLLFDHGAAGGGHYRLIASRRTALLDMHLDDLLWAGLGLPVDMAFLVRHDDEPVVTAHYPSPLGTVRAEVPARGWQRVEDANPGLSTMETEVEALLVHRGRAEHWLVGIDDCFRLAARVRASWTGMTGGSEVWTQIDQFFADLDETTRRAERNRRHDQDQDR